MKEEKKKCEHKVLKDKGTFMKCMQCAERLPYPEEIYLKKLKLYGYQTKGEEIK